MTLAFFVPDIASLRSVVEALAADGRGVSSPGAPGVPDYEFSCAECGASMLVDEGVRRLLAEDGCAVCGAMPPAEAFSPADGDADP